MLRKELSKSKHSSQQDENEEIIVRNKDVTLFMLRARMNDQSLSPASRREARRELLLKMGAKPPKRPVINYRILQEKKRQEKEEHKNDFRGEKSKQKILERMSGFGLLDKHYRRQAERQERSLKKVYQRSRPRQGESQRLQILQWNAGGMSPDKTIQVQKILQTNDVDLFTIMEANISDDKLKYYQFPDYTPYLLSKYRQVASGILTGEKEGLTSHYDLIKSMGSTQDKCEIIRLNVWKCQNHFKSIIHPRIVPIFTF
ncbi:unnamed protein product [Rodentolepis nana]|uniref:Endo/exonuclease/phosphatase domain-containing protein n=1 Tax=Rodentolepis nana TaxID=102285 RepID=A0A0R3TYZ1_RODNA|nr:unnamed protein product [Rodentolepis nana]